MTKVVYFSHGHPKYTKGGAEIFAYDLFRAANKRDGLEAWLFCAGRHVPFEGGVHCKNFSYRKDGLMDRQFVARTPALGYDYFYHRLGNGIHAYRAIMEQIDRIRPDLIHFQHYMGLGLPLIKCLKQNYSHIPIVLTLHDYCLICARDGKILDSSHNVCSSTDHYACNECVDMGGENSYAMREIFIKSILTSVDRFVSPSRYLIDRFAEWGINEADIVHIRNGRPFPCASGRGAGDTTGTTPDAGSAGSERKMHFAYFGQLMHVKGIFLMLDAISLLPEGINAVFYINGTEYGLDNSEKQRLQEHLERLKQNVVNLGPYEQEELPLRMANVDWVICPSIWPENAPLVVQEAFHYKKPIICPSSGAFPEFVVNNKTGIHFNRNDCHDLASKILMCCTSADTHKTISNNIEQQQNMETCLNEHIALYANLARRFDNLR